MIKRKRRTVRTLPTKSANRVEKVEGPAPNRRRRHSMMAFEMIRLDRTAREPLHQQLYRQIRDELVSTNGNDGAARLPSSRSLAGDLGISRLTVNLAFSKLTTEGYLRSQIGSGTFVAHPLPENFLSAQKPRYARAIERPPRLSHRVRNIPEKRAGKQFDYGSPGGPCVSYVPALAARDEFHLAFWD